MLKETVSLISNSCNCIPGMTGNASALLLVIFYPHDSRREIVCIQEPYSKFKSVRQLKSERNWRADEHGLDPELENHS